MCVAKTAIRRRRQMRLDKRYSGPRKDAQATATRAARKVTAAQERANRRKS